MNEEKFKFVFGDGKPAEGLCFVYNGAALVPERWNVARTKGQDANGLPSLNMKRLRSCPFCSCADDLVVDKDADGWYFVLCTTCGARGPRTRDGYLAAAWLWQLLRTDNEDPLLERDGIL